MAQTDWEAAMRAEAERYLQNDKIVGVLAAATKGLSGSVFWVGVGDRHIALLRRRGNRTDQARLLSPQDIASASFGMRVAGASPAAAVAASTGLS